MDRDYRTQLMRDLDDLIATSVITQASPRTIPRTFLETWFDPRPITDKIIRMIRDHDVTEMIMAWNTVQDQHMSDQELALRSHNSQRKPH